jgi:hypothetical protein
MGAGLGGVGVLLILTIVGLPLFFFALLAALDRFEQSLAVDESSPDSALAAPPHPLIVTVPAVAERASADGVVVSLPVATAGSASGRAAAAI